MSECVWERKVEKQQDSLVLVATADGVYTNDTFLAGSCELFSGSNLWEELANGAPLSLAARAYRHTHQPGLGMWLQQ